MMSEEYKVQFLKNIRDKYMPQRLASANPDVVKQWEEILYSDNLIVSVKKSTPSN